MMLVFVASVFFLLGVILRDCQHAKYKNRMIQYAELCSATFHVVALVGGPEQMLANLAAAARRSPLPFATHSGIPFTPNIQELNDRYSIKAQG